jgi:hypothetical protein
VKKVAQGVYAVVRHPMSDINGLANFYVNHLQPFPKDETKDWADKPSDVVPNPH